MYNLILLTGLFIFFFFINPFIISKIWSNKYTNFNFFETYLISFLLLIFIVFLLMTPIYVIYNNIKVSNPDSFNYIKYFLLVIQGILIIVYFFNWKKATFNIAFDIKKISVFFIVLFTYLLTWFLYINLSKSVNENYSFLVNNEQSMFAFSFSIIQNFAYNNQPMPHDDYIWFMNNIYFPSIIFLMAFATSSMFNYFKLFSLNNLKHLILVFVLLFLFLIFYKSQFYEISFITMNFSILFPILILLYSVTLKTNNEITTNSDLSAVVNIVILSIPFFNKDNFIISIFIFSIFIFYMYIMKFENSSLESLKMLSYVFLAFSLPNLISSDQNIIIYSAVFLAISIILLITINSFNRTNRFYENIRKVDNTISKKIILIIFVVFLTVLLLSFLLISDKDFKNYEYFFVVNGKLSKPFYVSLGVIWSLSFLTFIGSYWYLKKDKKLNNPIILVSLFPVLIYNPFVNDLLAYIFKNQVNIGVYYTFSLTMFLIPLFITMSNWNNLNFDLFKLNDKKNKIVELTVKIVSLTLLIAILILEILIFYGEINGNYYW